MKVVLPRDMSQLEFQAYAQGFLEESFMDAAGKGIAEVCQKYIESRAKEKSVLLLCGKGNNAGDAYVAGYTLLTKGYKVHALQVTSIDEATELCKKQYQRFVQEGGMLLPMRTPYPRVSLMVDGLFGTGFHGTVEEPFASVIADVNHAGVPVIAVDIPSGVDGASGKVQGNAIEATETVFLGLPKQGFFLADGWNHVGTLRYVNFGLPNALVDAFPTRMEMLTAEYLKPYLPKVIRNRHKYQAGYVAALAGSPGMPGAAILASLAALRGGAGIVRLFHPEGMQAELAGSPYELIREAYGPDDIMHLIEMLNKAKAIIIGPGIGRADATFKILREIIPALTQPCVIDADGLAFLAKEKVTLPSQTILTPHLGEIWHLLKISPETYRIHPVDEEILHRCQVFAEQQNVTLVVKGGPSFIFHPNMPIFVNATGHPGMATAGSGDVLTGLIAAFLAQGVATREAAALGVYLHGYAGYAAARHHTSYSMIASDILHHMPEAFRHLLL